MGHRWNEDESLALAEFKSLLAEELSECPQYPDGNHVHLASKQYLLILILCF
jgi:hypothetical protein